MSQKNYSLTDNVEDGFNFDVRGKVFFLRYPRTEEVETLQTLAEELKGASDEEKAAKNTELEVFMYGLITPVDHEESVKEVLKKENVRVMRNFNTMIKTELSLD